MYLTCVYAGVAGEAGDGTGRAAGGKDGCCRCVASCCAVGRRGTSVFVSPSLCFWLCLCLAVSVSCVSGLCLIEFTDDTPRCMYVHTYLCINVCIYVICVYAHGRRQERAKDSRAREQEEAEMVWTTTELALVREKHEAQASRVVYLSLSPNAPFPSSLVSPLLPHSLLLPCACACVRVCCACVRGCACSSRVRVRVCVCACACACACAYACACACACVCAQSPQRRLLLIHRAHAGRAGDAAGAISRRRRRRWWRGKDSAGSRYKF